MGGVPREPPEGGTPNGCAPGRFTACQNSFKMSPLALRRKCPLLGLFHVPHQVATDVGEPERSEGLPEAVAT
jgi:hypothetical protein